MSKFEKNDPRICRKGREKTYSQEVIDFIKAKAADYSDTELCEMLNTRFNFNMTRQSVKSLRRYYKIIKGRGKYDPYPVFTERVNKNGYIKIKDESGKWRNKHTYLWEQVNGKVPPGQIVIFLDGNKNNCTLENLGIVSKADQVMLTKLELRFTDPDYTMTGIAIVKHKQALRRRRKIGA